MKSILLVIVAAALASCSSSAAEPTPESISAPMPGSKEKSFSDVEVPITLSGVLDEDATTIDGKTSLAVALDDDYAQESFLFAVIWPDEHGCTAEQLAAGNKVVFVIDEGEETSAVGQPTLPAYSLECG